ncbi:hypothetical protein ABZ897_35530 [Nonomuraea sp. NPDC046802]
MLEPHLRRGTALPKSGTDPDQWQPGPNTTFTTSATGPGGITSGAF